MRAMFFEIRHDICTSSVISYFYPFLFQLYAEKDKDRGTKIDNSSHDATTRISLYLTVRTKTFLILLSLSPFEINDEDNPLDINDEENTGIQPNYQEIDKPKDSIALRTRSATRQLPKFLLQKYNFLSSGMWKTREYLQYVETVKIERINAKLVIMTRRQGTVKPETESLWEKIRQQWEELLQLLENGFDRATELIQEQSTKLCVARKLICIGVFL
ncbi:hypothetical protein LOAG_12081 [Loa loa]|uniref:Uncharacterized protein n=1 Tax=Loa loa TaxID=7209 RepID=A0A1S0TLY6_LOALO|nr:hypothetical protein LOAG_12081 [Loa loa]EFO16428.1 hypothetical protein LOAG_12081 [Loa loa]